MRQLAAVLLLYVAPAHAQELPLWMQHQNRNTGSTVFVIDDPHLPLADVAFRPASDRLTREGRRALLAAARSLNAPGRDDTVRINAFASSTPDESLRRQRILTVGRFMIAHGIACHRLQLFSVADSAHPPYVLQMALGDTIDNESAKEVPYRRRYIELTSIQSNPARKKARDVIDRDGVFVGNACGL